MFYEIYPSLYVLHYYFYSEQAEARRAKNKETRKRREERVIQKHKDLLRKISESEKKSIEQTKDSTEKK
jgi:hypothetical protein